MDDRLVRLPRYDALDTYSGFRLRSNGTRAPAPVVNSRVISNYR